MTHIIILLAGVVIGFALAWILASDPPPNAVLDHSTCHDEHEELTK